MKLLVVDGNSIINRAFYGIRALSNKKGVFTNAVTGFMNILLKLENNFKPDCVAVAFDLKAPTFRHKMYSEYKGTRKPMPEELVMQLPLVKDILHAMGIAVVEKEGWEADDILGTLAHAAELGGNSAVIATGDRDSFQLITESVYVNLAGNKEDILYTPQEIMNKYGVTPPQMLEVKALMGDSSDNIPGVKGVGEKTAFDLIQKYSTVSNIYDKLDSLEITAGLRKKLTEGKESCEISKKLGTIALDAPIDTDLNSYIPKSRDEVKLAEILTELEMFSVLKKMNISAENMKIANEKAAQKTIDDSTAEKSRETEEIVPDKSTPNIILFDNKIYVCNDSKFIEPVDLKEFLESGEEKRTFDLKALYAYTMPKGIELKNVVFDATLAAYLLDSTSNGYEMDKICQRYGVNAPHNKEELPDSLYRLMSKLINGINSQKLGKVLEEIEIPLAYTLTDMEITGVKVDTAGIDAFGKELEEKISQTESKIYELAGEKFNIGSPKQLGVILFEKLNLPYGKKTKTGYSTNADVLESLSDKHPIIPLISDYRAFTKLQSTYVSGLKSAVSNEDGRIHTTFKQTETRTGRISSAEPNIQNIPVRTELGRNMRKFFTAKEGCLLVDADYSQIELRVLAHLAGDEIMQQAFLKDDDIHAITASQVFNQPLEWVTPELRSRAKAVNFGIVYGIGAFSLSKDVGVSVAEAKQYIESYLAKYSGVDAFMKSTVDGAKKNLYVETMFGRRRYIPEINASNKLVQAAAKRIAMNTPIQGTAADIIKLAMIRVYDRLKAEGLPAKLILQVHDELIVEAEEAYAQKTAEILKEEMESCVKLAVPLTADVKIGKTWFDTH